MVFHTSHVSNNFWYLSKPPRIYFGSHLPRWASGLAELSPPLPSPSANYFFEGIDALHDGHLTPPELHGWRRFLLVFGVTYWLSFFLFKCLVTFDAAFWSFCLTLRNFIELMFGRSFFVELKKLGGGFKYF